MKNVFTFYLFILSITFSLAQPALDYNLEYSGFTKLVDIASSGDGTDRLFIVEQGGVIKIIENGILLTTPFIDISSKVGSSNGERGLLGLAFHPDYTTNGLFFVNYTDLSHDTAIERYSVSSNMNIADASSGAILLSIDQPYSNHNGGDLNFSPIDGYLYIGTGDGGSGGDPQCYAQNESSFLGKILRIDVDGSTMDTPNYSIPSSNPFIGSVDTLEEIWALGVRNPWRIAFDQNNGDLWIADVGQNQREEVHYQPANSTGGENYGWKVMEGTFCYDSDPIDNDCPSGIPSCNDPFYTAPIFEYGHNSAGGYSLTGGFIYHGCKYPALDGYYLLGDYITGNAWALLSNGTSHVMNDMPNNLSTFGLDNNGEMYLGTLNGNLYSIEETTHPKILNLNASDSPFAGIYNAIDSIIISGVTSVATMSTATFTAGKVIIQNEVEIPIGSEMIIDDGCE